MITEDYYYSFFRVKGKRIYLFAKCRQALKKTLVEMSKKYGIMYSEPKQIRQSDEFTKFESFYMQYKKQLLKHSRCAAIIME